MLPIIKKNQQNYLDNPISGFLNRNSCLPKILELISPSIQKSSLSIIWIALDRIKQINASFGHRGGDEVIAGIAGRLHNKSGVTAHWCRMAGDEFVCILPDHNSEQTRQIALAFLGEIQIPMPLHDLILYPSASLGIATLDDNETASNCLERADTAMKSAKLAGGGRVVISGAETLPGRMGIYLARHELEIENKLHLALAHGGLSLHYQPIVNSDGRIVSLEALMRCTSHQLAPGEFIPIAEKTSLIIRLGEWSLLEGARFAHRLASSGQPITVAINISRAQFSLPDFPQTLHAALLCANVRHELIELELTESLFMDNSVIVQTNLRATLDSGVKIAIDDFGTGYSCLAILKDINATKLKIDRAFVMALPHDTRAFSVVRAIAQLGNELDMLVVAEGVENQDQLDSLRDAGVHTIQGYINARPMPENEFLEWLQNRKTP
jgi:diguanylate cyclase (GGDEF)-like protein